MALAHWTGPTPQPDDGGSMALKIRNIENRDFPDWLPLWDGNNLGIRDEDVTTLTWSRLVDPSAPVHGLVAEKDGQLVGLLHFIVHPTTGNTLDVCYMQDVFVDPEFRLQGVARKLIEELMILGKTGKKWARIYWLAEEKNVAAQELYKSLGTKMNFTLHMMAL